MRSTPEPYVTRRELAEYIGVSVRTVDRWVRAGLPSYVWGARPRRFRISEVEASLTRVQKLHAPKKRLTTLLQEPPA